MWQIKVCLVFVFGVVLNDVAGRKLVNPKTENVGIVGGDEVDISEFPHQVALVRNGSHICGGSIISEEYVLTAAFCVFFAKPEDYKISAGASEWQNGVMYDVESIVNHEKFIHNPYAYDVAVLKVNGRIEINGVTTKAVELAQEGSKLNTGELMTVSGWGDTTGHGPYSSHLKATNLPIYDKKQCEKRYKESYKITLPESTVCAGFKEPGQSACYGESGGPLVDKNFVQHGMVMLWSPTCNKYDFPNVYTSVASHRSWIRKVSGV